MKETELWYRLHPYRAISVCCALLVVAFLPRVVFAQASTPLHVDADTVVYDEAAQRVEATGNVRLRHGGIRLAADEVVVELRTELITARGRVVLIDATGRELRGTELLYDVRREQADIRNAETIVDRVYMRSPGVIARRERITAREAMLTTCDPQRPLVRVTAASVEVFPGDRIVARRAALWIGGVRVLVLPTYTISLRTGEETSGSFPRFGYNVTDGLWVEYTYEYPVGSLAGSLATKYGTKSAWSFRNSLAYTAPGYTAALTIGRAHDPDFRPYDLAEVTLSLFPLRFGATQVGLSAGHGWFSEPATGVQTSRTTTRLTLVTPRVAVGPRTDFGMNLAYIHAWFGTGTQEGRADGTAALHYQLAPRTRLTLAHEVLEVMGASPFLFNTIDPARLHNRSIATITQYGIRVGRLETELSAGTGYSFRDRSPLYVAGFALKDTDRFDASVRGIYTVTTTELKLTFGSGIRIGTGTRLAVQGIYNNRTRLFEELDYTISARLCNCLDATLRYRQVSREIWFEIGLTGLPETRLQFAFPGP